MDTDKVMTHQKEANNLESNNQKVSITDLQSKLLSFEAELKEYRDTLEDLQANICEAENQTNAAKRTEEALELENILTLSDDTPDKITGSASVDNQEKNTITIPTRSWWQIWPTAPNHPPPTSGAEGGAGTGKVLEGTPDDHHQLQDNMINDPETMLGPNQSVTHIELEARLKKLQDGIKVNNFDKLKESFKESEEENLKETDRLLDDLENRLGAKITNMEQMMKKQTTDLETRLGSKITNQKIFINTLSEGYQQFTDIKEDLLTKNNLQPEIQNIMHDIHPTDPPTKADFDQLAVNVNQDITDFQTRMQGIVEKHTEDIKGTNNNLVTEIAHVTERMNQLEMTALNQNLVKDMASFNQKLISLQKNMSKQAGLPNRVTSLEQKHHNLSSRLGRMQELTDKIIPLEQLVEEIRDEIDDRPPMCKTCGARPCAMTLRCRYN